MGWRKEDKLYTERAADSTITLYLGRSFYPPPPPRRCMEGLVRVNKMTSKRAPNRLKISERGDNNTRVYFYCLLLLLRLLLLWWCIYYSNYIINEIFIDVPYVLCFMEIRRRYPRTAGENSYDTRCLLRKIYSRYRRYTRSYSSYLVRSTCTAKGKDPILFPSKFVPKMWGQLKKRFGVTKDEHPSLPEDAGF